MGVIMFVCLVLCEAHGSLCLVTLHVLYYLDTKGSNNISVIGDWHAIGACYPQFGLLVGQHN